MRDAGFAIVAPRPRTVGRREAYHAAAKQEILSSRWSFESAGDSGCFFRDLARSRFELLRR
jgi:hypothetical protein